MTKVKWRFWYSCASAGDFKSTTVQVPGGGKGGGELMVTNYHPRPVIISLLRANVCSEIAGWVQEVSTSFRDDGRDLSLIASVSGRQAVEGWQWKSCAEEKVVIVYQSEKVLVVYVKGQLVLITCEPSNIPPVGLW